ncbi:MAG: hypothetical protein ACK5WZ_04545 [Pseudobdellovibrionaceae bacterium]|jgi:hypothetical protein
MNDKTLENFRVDYVPSPRLQYFTFGYRDLVADLFWLRTIQNFDYCDSVKLTNSDGLKICNENSFLYRLLDLVTELSPNFRMPYASGGLALSVIITDVSGASHIFEKGTFNFPTDWPILYRSAYHAMIEEKNKKKAAYLLVEAARNGGPQWLYALSGKLFIEGGDLEMSLRLIDELNESADGKDISERIRKKIESAGQIRR